MSEQRVGRWRRWWFGRESRTARHGEGILHGQRCNHEWLYRERQSSETYTGYCEWCPKCGVLRQIVQ